MGGLWGLLNFLYSLILVPVGTIAAIQKKIKAVDHIATLIHLVPIVFAWSILFNLGAGPILLGIPYVLLASVLYIAIDVIMSVFSGLLYWYFIDSWEF